ncbi:aldo/keto reductase [Chryseobacterium lactis]|uniref:aldo/keto reductase n=1 Tax=Chryseobacterium lactis TaxID=1241981 RepID=UPI001BC8BD9E|nr:aldo/keto reductase [Chryseobacterium lactis]
MIEQRSLGRNGPKVSAIGLGTRTMLADRNIRSDQSLLTIETITAAVDAGINFLNTADFYGMGLNEMQIGEAIRGNRNKVFLSVKTGMRRSPSGAFLGMDCSPASIKNFCNYSLTRLGVDEIDLYQPARVDPAVPLEDTVGAIADLIKEGKVKYLGMSEVSAEQLKRANKIHPVSALEIEYSLATRFIEKEILPAARELGVTIMPYSVFYYGLLTGTVNGKLSKDDYRSSLPRFNSENLPSNLQKVDILKKLASEKGYSASQVALAWLLNQGDDIIPIVGMGKPGRIAENLEAASIAFTKEEINLLEKTFEVGAMQGERYPESLSNFVPS